MSLRESFGAMIRLEAKPWPNCDGLIPVIDAIDATDAIDAIESNRTTILCN